MVAVLTPAMYQISREFPSVTQRNFVDDRTWTAPSAFAALQVEALWTSWSGTLNLRENLDKTQYFHIKAAGRRSFATLGVPPQNVTDQACVLGNTFSPAQRRSLNPKERDRLDTAKKQIVRAGCLPISLKIKRAVISTGPMAKAEFGWCMYDPPLNACDQIDKAIRRALREPKQSCVHLRNILKGHRLNLGFRILTTCVNAIHRTYHNIPFPSWHRIGIASTINKFLTHMSWLRTEPWTWKHSITHATFSLCPTNTHFIPDRSHLNHLLREGFRADSYQRWSVSTRIDARACQNIEYSETRCQLARRCEHDEPHRFAILSGGFVSEAKFSVIKKESPVRCLVCNKVNDLDHMLWYCQNVPNFDIRPPIPRDWLQRRLGWPAGCPQDEATIAWMVHVRKWLLTHRYKPPDT